MKPRHSILLIAAFCFFGHPLRAADLPDGPGKDLIERECNTCHDAADHISRLKKTKDEWIDTVTSMINRGAGLSSTEFDTVIAYLVKNFGKQDSSVQAYGGSKR